MKLNAGFIKRFTVVTLCVLTLIIGGDLWRLHNTQVELSETLSASNWSFARFPLKKEDFVSYTSPYGWRWGRMHSGIDIAVDLNKDVLAWWDGTVEDTVERDTGGCGLEVFVISGRWDYRYCHLSSINVKKGDKVKAGQVLAKSGTTGSSTGPHLHWEVRFAGNLIDPARVIKAMKKADSSVETSSYPIDNSLRKRNENCRPCLL